MHDPMIIQVFNIINIVIIVASSIGICILFAQEDSAAEL